jgi:hypothetical protein
MMYKRGCESVEVDIMEDVEQLVRHLEDVVSEIEVLKGRLSYLEDHRAELRERITAIATGRDDRTLQLLPTSSTPGKSRRRLRPSQGMALSEAADTVAAMEGEVNAEMLAERMKISFDAARLRLARAARKGLLVRVSLGKYRAPNRIEAHGNGNGHNGVMHG